MPLLRRNAKFEYPNRKAFCGGKQSLARDGRQSEVPLDAANGSLGLQANSLFINNESFEIGFANGPDFKEAGRLSGRETVDRRLFARLFTRLFSHVPETTGAPESARGLASRPQGSDLHKQCLLNITTAR